MTKLLYRFENSTVMKEWVADTVTFTKMLFTSLDKNYTTALLWYNFCKDR